MSHSHHKSHRTLARNHACEIQHCGGCDILHVVVGPVTLRLHATAARLLCGALSQALSQLPTDEFAAMPLVMGPTLQS